MQTTRKPHSCPLPRANGTSRRSRKGQKMRLSVTSYKNVRNRVQNVRQFYGDTPPFSAKIVAEKPKEDLNT